MTDTVRHVLPGLVLILCAAANVWVARDERAIEGNHRAAWLVRLVGRPRSRPVIMAIVAFMALLGVVTMARALAGGELGRAPSACRAHNDALGSGPGSIDPSVLSRKSVE